MGTTGEGSPFPGVRAHYIMQSYEFTMIWVFSIARRKIFYGSTAQFGKKTAERLPLPLRGPPPLINAGGKVCRSAVLSSGGLPHQSAGLVRNDTGSREISPLVGELKQAVGLYSIQTDNYIIAGSPANARGSARIAPGSARVAERILCRMC